MPHATAATAAFVLGGYVDRPDVEPGCIVQVHRNPPDREAVLAGDAKNPQARFIRGDIETDEGDGPLVERGDPV